MSSLERRQTTQIEARSIVSLTLSLGLSRLNFTFYEDVFLRVKNFLPAGLTRRWVLRNEGGSIQKTP